MINNLFKGKEISENILKEIGKQKKKVSELNKEFKSMKDSFDSMKQEFSLIKENSSVLQESISGIELLFHEHHFYQSQSPNNSKIHFY